MKLFTLLIDPEQLKANDSHKAIIKILYKTQIPTGDDEREIVFSVTQMLGGEIRAKAVLLTGNDEKILCEPRNTPFGEWILKSEDHAYVLWVTKRVETKIRMMIEIEMEGPNVAHINTPCGEKNVIRNGTPVIVPLSEKAIDAGFRVISAKIIK